MRSVRLYTSLLPIAFSLALALGGCGEQKPDTEAVSQPGKAIQARIVSVNNASLAGHANSPGTVTPEHQVQVASRLMGYIREIKVREGQAVKAGQLLFVVDPTDIQGQVSQAKAGLAQAEAALADAQSDYDRFGALYKDEAIPKMQWDKVRLQYQVAKQQVAAARAGLATASSQMRYASVSSPIAGIVTQKMANTGDLAAPGRPVLAIENLKTLQVSTNVSDEVFGKIQSGDKVDISQGGQGKPLTGIISQVVPSADPVSHTHLVKIDLPANSGLQSGDFVQVGFSTGPREGIRIPADAVVDRAGITGVFVIDPTGIARFRMVRTGASQGDMIEILSGLNPAERVAASNVDQIDNGDKVSGGAE
jgi:multidrug efflux system membrane fusion protein